MTDSILLSRADLEALTDCTQAAAMARWLHRHNWVFEEPNRRGEIPKVARSYFDAKMTGAPLPGATRRAGPRVDFFNPRTA